MSMINVSIVGNLTKAPEQIVFASGKVKTILLVAVSNYQKNDAGERVDAPPDYYRVEVWGKVAELAQKYLNKGNQVGVAGRLIMERWTDREGNDRMTPVVSATQLSFPTRFNKEDSRSNSAKSYEDDDLFAGARAVTVAEPPMEYYYAANAMVACAPAAVAS